jgi:DNA-binding NarL/FixJ family response regulator
MQAIIFSGRLSKRELEVLQHLMQGKTARQIGELLFISKRTVEHHIETIKQKACCHNKFELIMKIYEQSSIL